MKIIATVVLVYVEIVAAFEASIGYFQPAPGSTLVITTFDGEGTPYDRAVSRSRATEALRAATNHRPRAWYRWALVTPGVRMTMEGERDHRAVPITDTEHDRVEHRVRLGAVFRR